MRVAEIKDGGTYLAYCGSLARVRVIEAGVPYEYGGRTTREGVLVEALADIPFATAPSRMAHRAGEQFVIRSRDVDREEVPKRSTSSVIHRAGRGMGGGRFPA